MISYFLFLIISNILMLFPRFLRKKIYLSLSHLAYALSKKHRNIIRINLKLAFGESLSETRIEELTRKCFHNLILNSVQIIENQKLSHADIAKMVTIENREILDKVIEQGRGVVLITGHFGNWEIGAAAIGSMIMPTLGVYKPLKNPYFSKYLFNARARFGLKMYEKEGAIRHLAKALKKKESVSLLIDQSVSSADGQVVQFFDNPCTQVPSPAQLARKYNAAVIPVFLHNVDDNHFILRFEEEVLVEKSDDADKDIREATQKQADVLQSLIEAEPDHWFWCHKRWKNELPEIYKNI